MQRFLDGISRFMLWPATPLLLFAVVASQLVFARGAAAQDIPEFKPMWNKLFQHPQSFRPTSDTNWPGKEDDWWVITISPNRMTTSNIKGCVTLKFDRAWAQLPTTAQKDPLDPTDYYLGVQLDLIYNNQSRKTYSNHGSSFGENFINETDPDHFLLSLPQSIIIQFPVSSKTDISNLFRVIKARLKNHKSYPNIGFFLHKVSNRVAPWQTSTVVQPNYSILFQPVKCRKNDNDTYLELCEPEYQR